MESTRPSRPGRPTPATQPRSAPRRRRVDSSAGQPPSWGASAPTVSPRPPEPRPHLIVLSLWAEAGHEDYVAEYLEAIAWGFMYEHGRFPQRVQHGAVAGPAILLDPVVARTVEAVVMGANGMIHPEFAPEEQRIWESLLALGAEVYADGAE